MENKMTIAYSVALYNVLDKILYVEGSNCENLVERELPFTLKYKLQRDLDIVLKDYLYYQSERSKLIKEYGTEKDDKISVEPDKMEQFREELLKSLSIEVEHNFTKITPEEVLSIPGDIKVDCNEMNLFITYLTDDEVLMDDLSSKIGE